jgi:ribosomal-protein-alanine N-acetyltransferase
MSEAIGAQEAPPMGRKRKPGRRFRPVGGEAEVRLAGDGDVGAAAAGIGALLQELGGEGPSPAELEAATRKLIEEPALGALLVAEADGEIVGVLAASWQHAVHVPGRYGVVQDLWVSDDWRSRAIGRDLLDALAALAREQGVFRLEVGLPQDSFAAIEATRSFYLANDFASLGPRMRRLLS